MPTDHWVLVAERRGITPRKRKREVIYATDDESRARRDAEDMGKTNRRMRFYVMPYSGAVEVARRELNELEAALESAKIMKAKMRGD
jgi:hypothetical protein